MAEENSRKAAELNEKVLASLHSHIAILNRSGTIIAVNDAWSEFALANGAAASGLGVNYLDVCRRADSAGDLTALRTLEGIRSVLEGASECLEMEYSCDSPAKHRSFLMRVVPLRTSDGGAVVSHTDITQLRRAEVEAQELRRDLAHVQRASTMAFSPRRWRTSSTSRWAPSSGMRRPVNCSCSRIHRTMKKCEPSSRTSDRMISGLGR